MVGRLPVERRDVETGDGTTSLGRREKVLFDFLSYRKKKNDTSQKNGVMDKKGGDDKNETFRKDETSFTHAPLTYAKKSKERYTTHFSESFNGSDTETTRDHTS